MDATASVQDYLGAIYDLAGSGKPVIGARLAKYMKISAPAVTEAMYLLGFSWQAQDALWEMIDSGALTLFSLDSGDVPRMRELMRKYRDLPMDAAHAALVRIGEREGIRWIFTIDRRDFLVYRPARLGRFSVVP